MGNTAPDDHPEPPEPTGPLKITYHAHRDTPGLLRIFRMFQHQPHAYINSIEIMVQEEHCCDRTILKLVSPRHTLTVDNVLSIKRATKKGFLEKQIWYIANVVIKTMCYLQSGGLAYGGFNPGMLNIVKGRFVALQIMHLLPQNQHTRIFSFHNYYSPQLLNTFHTETGVTTHIDLPRSQVYSLGLLLLQISTCPSSKPKFYKLGFRQLHYAKIYHRLQAVRQRYSTNLYEFMVMALRPDVRSRPDWGYLKVWMGRNQNTVDLAPCLYLA